jgi:primosomal protein N' (replication factor Y)
VGPDHRNAGEKLTAVVQVVPEVASFAVDDGFAYELPERFAARVAVGSMVRVPLGGRRVRGYVVGYRRDVPDRIKPILGVSGDLPVFTARLLETLRWTARHYVAPVAAVLGKAAPPNVPQRGGFSAYARAGETHSKPGRDSRYLLGGAPWDTAVRIEAEPVLAANGSAVVIVPTFEEARRLAAGMQSVFADRVALASSRLPAKQVTAAWVRATTMPGTLLVATAEAAFWPVANLGRVIVVEEGRRAMKAKQTPTWHVREVMRKRAAIEGFPLTYLGSVPTVEAFTSNATVSPVRGRVWPLVEIADRSEEPPGAGVLLERTRRAVHAVVASGGRVFVFTPRRGYAAAFRCVRCGTVRQCAECNSGPGRGAECVRCGAATGPCSECGGKRFAPIGAGAERVLEELARSLRGAAGTAGTGVAVEVGTERDLPGAGRFDLAVIVDGDGLLLAPHYRAAEDALRIMARVAALVERGRGKRCLVQTAMPDHGVFAALRHGSPVEFLEEAATERIEAGFPPAGEVIVVEVDRPPEGVDARLRELAGTDNAVFGPAVAGEHSRWLVQGRDLGGFRTLLRAAVQEWRDRRARVRIDVDPTEL